MSKVTTIFPKLEEHRNRLEQQKYDAQTSLKDVSDQILALQKQEQKFEEIKNLENNYLLTVGRISLWLESFETLPT